jgi:glycosyltransferase involved in cell wall biosynthesis
MQDHVLERNDCSDAELVSWLQHARALLFPSFAEGYGMPLVEALGHGVPVIASDLPVFREIAGTIPDYLDPLDGPAWLRLLRSYAAPDSAERGSQLQRLQYFRVPTWQHHFQLVDAFLEERLPQSQKAS